MQEQNRVGKDNVDSTHQANNEIYEYKTIEHQKKRENESRPRARIEMYNNLMGSK